MCCSSLFGVLDETYSGRKKMTPMPRPLNSNSTFQQVCYWRGCIRMVPRVPVRSFRRPICVYRTRNDSQQEHVVEHGSLQLKFESRTESIVTVTAMNATPLLAEDACLSALCDVIIFKWWAWHVLNNAKYLGQDRATKMRQAYNEALLQRPDIPKLRCSGKIRAHTFVPKWWR